MQCDPMDEDYPRINTSCMEMVLKLLLQFDEIEESDPLYVNTQFQAGVFFFFHPVRSLLQVWQR